MSSKIEFVEAENTDREYPNAFIIDEAMFKVNGVYVCVEPCGGGGFYLGDQYIYVSSDGDDNSREGLIDDPFLTIEGAMNYINSFATLKGDIYLVFLDVGPFYINETLIINHLNKITYIGFEGDEIIDPDPDPDPPVSTLGWYGDTFVMAGADDEYGLFQTFSIASGGTSMFFGSTVSTHGGGYWSNAALSDITTGIMAGGWSDNGAVSTIDYITFASHSDLTNFGSLTDYRDYPVGCCDGTTGLIMAGYSLNEYAGLDSIESITVASTGNSIQWGTLTVNPEINTAVGNETIALSCGGWIQSLSDECDYIDSILYASGGTATRYGNLTEAKDNISGCSNHTYGYVVAGEKADGYETDRIEQISFASESNATIWGNGDNLVEFPACASDGNDVGIIAGGYDPDSYIDLDTIEKFTLGTFTHTSNYGDLTTREGAVAGMSGD